MGVTSAGGAETMMNDLVQHLASVGWDATALILDGPTSDQMVGQVRVTCPPNKHVVHDLTKTADLIITQLGATPRARGMGRVYGIPVAQLIHNSSEYTVGFLGDGCDFAIYNSHWLRKFHDQAKKVTLLKSWQNYQVTSLKRRSCYDWNSVIVHPPVLDGTLKESTGKYITLVNLTPNKGPDLFYELAELHPWLEFMGVIGGYELDKQVVRDLPNVTIHPHTQDMDSVYMESAIVLMPSKYESYGRVAVEAAQYGIPAVVSNTPGLREALERAGNYADTRGVEVWGKILRSTILNYDQRRAEAHSRYSELYQQSIPELKAFAEAMERLVKEWDSSRSQTSN